MDLLTKARIVAIAIFYIIVSISLILFNKYLLSPQRFPYAATLSTLHMLMTSVLSQVCFWLVPSWYPQFHVFKSQPTQVLRLLVPIGMLFAVALHTSNQAYLHSSVPFLQFMKEGNVVIVYIMSLFMGVQSLSGEKALVILWIFLGCRHCVNGEVQFVWIGFVLQLVSQICECSKNVIGEIAMTGSGLKLDALTYTLILAPISLVPLVIYTCATYDSGLTEGLQLYWPLLLANASLAFVLNVAMATTIKNLSAMGVVMCGVIKDIAVVGVSSLMGVTVTLHQWFAFAVMIAGVAAWSHIKIHEKAAPLNRLAEPAKDCEQQPLVCKEAKSADL